jgi:rubrerythrin
MHHDHAHPQGQEAASPLSFEEKLIKLLEHWIRHNEGHVSSYVEWARKAEASELTDIGRLLYEAADETLTASAKFDEALELLRKATSGHGP